MLKPLRHYFPRPSDYGPMALAVLAALFLTSGMLLAQQKPLHLNPVIAKLVEGKTVYGLNTGDLSLAYAREVARASRFCLRGPGAQPAGFPGTSFIPDGNDR